ncbi:hypothetical protein T4A_1738 [Trichinella pseudospiralis]|uniref:Uncharacterized protein n=1 Tax=Trichinella pseudospiralis TaxID=6337 RepID=A0A0V1ENF4_TRIPS|nr:hypothetical protein T4A_1738 [Trichinella pseudospiralis]
MTYINGILISYTKRRFQVNNLQMEACLNNEKMIFDEVPLAQPHRIITKKKSHLPLHMSCSSKCRP